MLTKLKTQHEELQRAKLHKEESLLKDINNLVPYMLDRTWL